MSEYQFVEKPLLNQLESMGWRVIDQGPGIPQDPSKSLRLNFREVVIKSQFIQTVNAINLHNGKPWLTEHQLDDLYQDFCDFDAKSLLLDVQVF